MENDSVKSEKVLERKKVEQFQKFGDTANSSSDDMVQQSSGIWLKMRNSKWYLPILAVVAFVAGYISLSIIVWVESLTPVIHSLILSSTPRAFLLAATIEQMILGGVVLIFFVASCKYYVPFFIYAGFLIHYGNSMGIKSYLIAEVSFIPIIVYVFSAIFLTFGLKFGKKTGLILAVIVSIFLLANYNTKISTGHYLGIRSIFSYTDFQQSLSLFPQNQQEESNMKTGSFDEKNTSLSIAPIQNPKSNFQYFQFILPTRDRNIIQCERYSDYELSFKCYTALAVLHKDVSYCNNIKSSFDTGLMHRDSCFDEVARETQDVALCENIVDKNALTGDYVNCVASIKKDVSKCPQLGEPYNGSNQCYLDVAVAKKDLSICDLFGDDTDSKHTCYEGVAEVKQDSSICELGDPTSEQKDHCYGKLLTQNQNLAFCEKFETKRYKDICKLSIVRETAVRDNNIGICNNFTDQSDKNSCYWEVAYGQNNPSLCELIKPDQYDLDTNQCVIQSSPAISDPSMCDSLKGTHNNIPNKDLCYFQYATVNQKPVSCNKMTNASFKDKCLKEIANDIITK